MTSAQKLAGVPPLSEAQREAVDVLDGILRRNEVMHAMRLQPGDMQIINDHVTLHLAYRVLGFAGPGAQTVAVPVVAGAAGVVTAA